MTLTDVATAVGLSTAAVSLALRGRTGVSDATRASIVEAARALGYQAAIREPRHRKLATVGLVIKTLQGEAPEANRFYAPVMAGVEESCRSHNMHLMLATMPVDHHYYPIEVPDIVTDLSCDGLIVVGAHFPAATAEILKTAAPVVLVDAYADDDAFDSVVTDNIVGARTAVEHLVSRGHRNIALLAADPDSFPSILARRRGYEQVLAEAGLPPHYIDAGYWRADSAAVTAVSYLQAHPEVSAVFCANDVVAIALLLAARQAGISIPDRLSVVGFDDIDTSAFVSPALTTVAVDKVGMGHMAVALLAHRLEFGRGYVTHTLVQPALVERDSTRPLDPATPRK